MINLVVLTLMPGIHYAYARPEMHERFTLLQSKSRDSEQNFKVPRGDGRADKQVPSWQLRLCIENKSGDYRGDWSRGVALTMADDPANPMRPFGPAPLHPPPLLAASSIGPSDGASS